MARAFIYEDPLDEPIVDDHLQTCRGAIFGLPRYMSSRDLSALLDTLSLFGVARVEYVCSGYASITFDNPKSLKRAVDASGRIYFLGNFLTLKAKFVARNYFEYFSNSNDEDVVNPKYLEYRGNITQQILALMNTITFVKKDVVAFPRIANDLQQVMRRGWRDCRVIMYGSMVTGLQTIMSDVDCYIYIPREESPMNDFRFNRAQSIFRHRSNVFLDVEMLEDAPIPTFKFFHIPTTTFCKVTLKSYLCVYTTRLIKYLFGINESFRPAALVIKYWAQVHGLSGKEQISSYALMVLFVFYLQQPPCYIPSIYYLQRASHAEVIVDNWNVSFLNKYDTLPKHNNPIWIPDLLGGFFAFYANFNFKDFVISPFLGRTIMKRNFESPEDLPDVFEKYKQNIAFLFENPLNCTTPVVVQDQLELNNNITRALSTAFVRKFQEYCKFGFEAYNVGKLNNHRHFLRIILCEKPRSLQSDQVSKFTWVEHVYKNFGNDVESWRLILIEHLIMIMKDVCKIKLFKFEERRIQNNTRVESVYIGMIKNPIWNRLMAPAYPEDFLERETEFTNIILNTAARANVNFSLVIWHMEGSNSVDFEISYVMGDKADFIKFGLFFQNHICKWLRACMVSFDAEASQSGQNRPNR